MGNFFSASELDYDAQLKSGVHDPKYSYKVSEADEKNDFGPIYRPVTLDEGKPLVEGFTYNDETGETRYSLWDIFIKGLTLAGRDAEFLGTRAFKVENDQYVKRADGTIDRFDYVFDTYGEIHDACVGLGRGLVKIGAPVASNIALFSTNRSEWLITQLGLYTQNMTVVPLYPTLGPDSVEYIINQAETQTVIVSKDNLPKLLPILEKVKNTVKHVVILDVLFDGKYGNTLDTIDPAAREKLEAAGLTVQGFSEVIALGNEEQVVADVPVPYTSDKEHPAFIMFTSGTTGNPKGVVLTHNNISSCMGCVKFVVSLPVGFRHFSYLPLAHVFEVVVNCVAWSVGGSVCFSQGDVRRIVDDLQAVKPNLLPAVPRIFVKFYQAIWSQVAQMGLIKRLFIYRAFNYQLNLIRQNKPLDPWYDQKVFSLMRTKLGLDNSKILITGGAPCPGYIVEFMRVITGGAWFIQGYGMTESTGGTAIPLRGDHFVGHVGTVLPCLEYRLAAVPDMGYDWRNEDAPTGELLLGGHTVFKGYYRNPEATAETLVQDEEGRTWLRTGDIARFNVGLGTISIIDRKKSLLKLAQGEYVSLEKLQACYGKSPIVQQVFCYGNSYKSQMVGVVAPNPAPLYEFLKQNNMWNIAEEPKTGALTDAVIAEFQRAVDANRDAVEAHVLSMLKQQEKGLFGFEKLKQILVDVRYADPLGQVWNEMNGLMTPTMKLKYQPLARYYHTDLDRMYTALGEPSNPGEKYY